MQNTEQLKIGDIVDVNAGVPVMPRLKLRQVRRGDIRHRLKPHHKFKVIGIGKNGRVWYKVATEWKGMRVIGWVNSVCLVGKSVKVSKDSNQNKLNESIHKERVCAEICTVIVIIVVTVVIFWRVLSGL